MALILLQLLTVCLAAVIQLMSSQSTVDVAQDNDVSSCGHTDHVLSVLNQLLTMNSQLQTAVRLETDVAELKTACTAAPKNGARCPADFVYNASVNGCYKVVTKKLNWTAAGFECRSLHQDAHLLVIRDAEEQLAIALMLSSTDQATQSACSERRFWTAGQRSDPQSAVSPFVWRVITSTDMATYSDTVSQMTYQNWYTGEPNNLANAEFCVELYNDHSSKWNDRPCNQTICSVCELDI